MCARTRYEGMEYCLIDGYRMDTERPDTATGRQLTVKRRTRRDLLFAGLGIAAGIAISPAVGAAFHRILSPDASPPVGGAVGAAAPGWTFSPANPVLDVEPTSTWDNAAVYDAAVVRRATGELWMWYSTRGASPSSIALAIDPTGTGDHWLRFPGTPVVQPIPFESRPYNAITRPSVLETIGGWRMWYSVVDGNATWIGTAASADGMSWTKYGSPVLEPRDRWEKSACQCPNVLYDDVAGVYKMWYSAGEVYEPNAIGYATSPDGYTWTRQNSEPIYVPTTGWENDKIGSFQVRRVGEWYYAFYNAFERAPFVSRIGLARSRDGITAWQRHPHNPILGPGRPGSWNSAMVYKPTVLWNEQRQRWDVWFNASSQLNGIERIGHAWSNALW